VDGARGVAEGRVGRADPAAGPDPAPQQLEQDGERVGVPQGHHAHLDVGVQLPGRADPPPGQERLGVREPLLGEPGRLDGHHDEDSFPGQRSSLAASHRVSRSGMPPVNTASTRAERSRAPASSSSAAASR
jgi:hypothetical protein